MLEKLDYKEYKTLYSMLEKLILFKENFWDFVWDLGSDNPISNAIMQHYYRSAVDRSITMDNHFEINHLVGDRDKIIEFPDAGKNVDIIDLSPKRPDTLLISIIKPDGKIVKQEMKVGRLIQALMKDNKPEDIEEFVRFLSSMRIDIKDTPFQIKLVHGEDIVKYYNEDNYDVKGAGELGKSCMRRSDTAEYIWFYARNPDKVSLAVMLTPEDRVLGRALVWKTDRNLLYMDRIYGQKAVHKDLIQKWGKDNDVRYFYPNGDMTVSGLKDHDYFPYMDTFKQGYYDKKGLQLCSNMKFIQYGTRFLRFENTEGYAETRYLGYDGEVYDEEGYDDAGYNEDGFDRDGYDVDGYDVDGYDSAGRDKDGYDTEGYDKDGYDRDGYDVDGFDKDGESRDN